MISHTDTRTYADINRRILIHGFHLTRFLIIKHGRIQNMFMGAKDGKWYSKGVSQGVWGTWDGSPPAGSRGRAPVGVWGAEADVYNYVILELIFCSRCDKICQIAH